MAAAGSALLDWVNEPRPDRGIRFATGESGWEELSYDELAASVRSAAHRIADHEAASPVVSIVLPSGREFVSAFFGTQLAGRTPSPIATPGSFRDLDEYRAHVARIAAVADPGVVVTDEAHAPLVTSAMELAGRDVPVVALDGVADRGPLDAPPAELALLQFTSGSSGSPKGVRVTWSNLEASAFGLVDQLRVREAGHMATWLPLHHDMGLVACLLPAVSAQASLSVVRPEQFVRRPARWLESIGPEQPTVTVTATFAFGYAASRVSDAELARLDLDSWYLAVLGAERVNAETLDRFARRFARRGFRPEVFDPGYGMAEVTVGAAICDFGVVPNAVRIEPGSLSPGRAVDGPVRRLTELSSSQDLADWLVSSGRPICGCKVRIVGADGTELEEGRFGEIVLSGPAVCEGYLGEATEQLTRFIGGELHTGDAGFVRDGELYVVGRMGDAISARGRTVYLEDVEATIAGVEGLVQGRFAVVAGADEIVALVEQPQGPWTEKVRAVLVRHVGTDMRVRVRTAERGTIQRTTSGKPRRRMMWQELLAGRLPGEDVAG